MGRIRVYALFAVMGKPGFRITLHCFQDDFTPTGSFACSVKALFICHIKRQLYFAQN